MTDYLSVTRLASRVCTSGDLHSESNEKSVDAIEGIKIQQLIQKRMEIQEPRYSAEQTVQLEVSICGDLQMLRGRIDGFINLSPTLGGLRNTKQPDRLRIVEVARIGGKFLSTEL